jgi:hypothetical protein
MSFPFARSDDIWWYSIIREDFEPDQFKQLIEKTVEKTKEALPSGKLAVFGTQPSPQGSLRHDSNVQTHSGGEGDHDSGQMSFQEAVDRLNAAGIIAIVHTTPSHTGIHPRWRVWIPFSKELLPHERERMTNRLNLLLGGVLARESWGSANASTMAGSMVCRSKSRSPMVTNISTNATTSIPVCLFNRHWGSPVQAGAEKAANRARRTTPTSPSRN